MLKMITGTLYTVCSYIHTVSVLCGLTVSIEDAFTPVRFMRFVAGLSRSHLTHCQHDGHTVSHGRQSHVSEQTARKSMFY